jgi:hypothetical protein
VRESIEYRVEQVEDGKQANLVSGTNIKTINGSSLLGSGNLVVGGGSFSGDMDDIPDGTTYVKTENNYTDADAAKVAATSGTNTGDQTSIVGISGTKANFDTACSDGDFVFNGDAIAATNITEDSTHRFVTDTEKSTWNGKQNALTNPVTGTGTNNEIAAFNSTGSTITSLSTATYPSLTELSYVKGVTSAIQTQLNGKEPTITNGFGISGTTTKAVSLTSTQAFCTAETTLNTATYADITGASISLAAGTWLIMATANGSSQTTTATSMIIAITDGSNNVIAEAAQDIAAGTATVRTWGNLSLSAVVTPSGTTTYKLRGARGTTTRTGNCIISDGVGVNTANNVSNNSDKSTVIMAVRIA